MTAKRRRETERDRMARWQRVNAGVDALLRQEFPEDVGRRGLLAEYVGMHIVSHSMINRLLDRPPEEAADEVLAFLRLFVEMFHDDMRAARTPPMTLPPLGPP